MRTRLMSLATVLVSALCVTPLAAAGAAADDYPAGERIAPATLPRGPDVRLTHAEGKRIVAGAYTLKLEVPRAHLSLVSLGEQFVVMVSDQNYEHWRLLRVNDQGRVEKRLAGGPGHQPDFDVSSMYSTFVVLASDTARGRRVRVLSAWSGEVVRSRVFPATLQLVEYGKYRLLLSQWANRRTPARTFWWNPQTNRTETIARDTAYLANSRANRVGFLRGDPYQGGCQRVTRLRGERTTLWRSCRDIALSFSPQGKRMVTGNILQDGPGPRVVQVRGVRGRVLDTYRSRWFGFFAWESDTRLVMQAAGKDTVAVVRCTLRRCERASKLYNTDGRAPWNAMPSWSFPTEF